MYGFAIFALLAFTAVLAKDEPCLEVETVDNFEYSDFAQGKWYEYSRYNSNAGVSGKCGSAEYTLEGDIFKIKNCNVLNGKQKCIEGTGKLASDAGKNGKLICSYPYGPNGTMTQSQVNVLATDNKNYAILHFCKYIEQRNMRVELSWVLSRSKVLSDDAKAAVDKFIKESSVLGSKNYVVGDFSDEACKIEG